MDQRALELPTQTGDEPMMAQSRPFIFSYLQYTFTEGMSEISDG